MARLGLAATVVLLAGCVSQQSGYVPLAGGYDPLPGNYPVEIYRFGLPEKPFERIARLDVHIEKTHFLPSDFEDAIPELTEQARRSGSHAIIEVEERQSSILETKIYHVTATGVRYLED